MRPRIAVPVPTSANLVYNEQNWPVYAEAVRASGGDPVQVTLDLTARAVRELALTCEGFLLTGSPADVAPGRYGQVREEFTAEPDEARETVDLILLDIASKEGKPLLAVCFGMQMMNVWSGGTLVQDLAPMPINHAAGRSVAVAHLADLDADSELARLADVNESSVAGKRVQLPINSSHHQAIGIAGRGLRITARSRGDGVAEAIEPERSESFLLGVQWHPERSFPSSATSRAIFREFVRRAGESGEGTIAAASGCRTG